MARGESFFLELHIHCRGASAQEWRVVAGGVHCSRGEGAGGGGGGRVGAAAEGIGVSAAGEAH